MQIFISHFVFRRQPAEFFFSKKICQMKAGQNNKYDITKALGLVMSISVNKMNRGKQIERTQILELHNWPLFNFATTSACSCARTTSTTLSRPWPTSAVLCTELQHTALAPAHHLNKVCFRQEILCLLFLMTLQRHLTFHQRTKDIFTRILSTWVKLEIHFSWFH